MARVKSDVIWSSATSQSADTRPATTTIDGDTGLVTLASAPDSSATVTITYYFNTWQNTFDYLPETPTEVVSVGVAPGDSTYIQDTDYVGIGEYGEGHAVDALEHIDRIECL